MKRLYNCLVVTAMIARLNGRQETGPEPAYQISSFQMFVGNGLWGGYFIECDRDTLVVWISEYSANSVCHRYEMPTSPEDLETIGAFLATQRFCSWESERDDVLCDIAHVVVAINGAVEHAVIRDTVFTRGFLGHSWIENDEKAAALMGFAETRFVNPLLASCWRSGTSHETRPISDPDMGHEAIYKLLAR